MLSRKSSTAKRVAFSLGALALTAGAWAGTTIDAWELQKTQQQERVRMRWSEPVSFQTYEFPASRQLLVRLPEASLAKSMQSLLDVSKSSAFESVRVQPVTLSDGRDGVQLTFTLKQWQKAKISSSARFLMLSLDGTPAPLPTVDVVTPAASTQQRLSLSNADIDAYLGGQFGSENAPATGAGQAAAAPASGGVNSFYVPPDLTTDQKKAETTGVADLGTVATQELLNRPVDLDFKDAELQNIIRSIAAKLKLNVIMRPGQVKGTVTVSLTNVRLADALDSLLKSNDLAYKIEAGGIVRIVDRSDVRGNEKEVEVRSIAINWLDAKDLSTVIQPFLSQSGKVEFSTQSNILIVQDVPENLGSIQDLVYRLDVPEKQVRMETRLVDLSERAQRDLGFTWSAVDRGSSDHGILTDTVGNPTTVTDGSLRDTTVKAGIPFIGVPALDVLARDHISVLGQHISLGARLQALEGRNEAVTLATPTILSLNNIEATIEIKRQIPYQDAVNTATGSVATIKFADVGVKVVVTPRITNNGHVTLVMKTEQKIEVDEKLGTPVLDERNTETSVTVKDDQTVALGGLRQFHSLAAEGGTPWLMRAPVLGWLFKNTQHIQEKLDLYLFVTPHIIKDPEPTPHERAVFDKIDYNWDLPDYYFDEIRARKSQGEINDPRIKDVNQE